MSWLFRAPTPLPLASVPSWVTSDSPPALFRDLHSEVSSGHVSPPPLESCLSRTCKLLTQITRVCKGICDIKGIYSSKKNRSPLGTGRTSKEHLPDKYEKGETDYTRSTDNKKHVRCEDLHNSLRNQTRHASPVPLDTSSIMSLTNVLPFFFRSFLI